MININAAIDYMYGLRARNIRYSMDYSRTGADGTGDCSGTLYAALRKAGATNAGWVLNTDSMHDWLLKNGFRLIARNQEWHAKRGDIVIFGEKGKSANAAGHVVIFINNTQIIHCTWKSDAVNGVFVENEATAYPYFSLLGLQPYANAFVLFYIASYAISITENLGQMGVPIPTFVKERIEKLRDLADKGDEGK